MSFSSIFLSVDFVPSLSPLQARKTALADLGISIFRGWVSVHSSLSRGPGRSLYKPIGRGSFSYQPGQGLCSPLCRIHGYQGSSQGRRALEGPLEDCAYSRSFVTIPYSTVQGSPAMKVAGLCVLGCPACCCAGHSESPLPFLPYVDAS